MLANRLGIEMRHLQALDAVARHRSFNGAADELGYTQSAVSQQIVSLERLVGARLFDRASGRHPVRLTEAGRMLLSHAESVLERVDAATADITALLEGAVGEFRLGTYQSVATRLLPEVLFRFRALWPRIAVRLFESGSHDDIDDRVERGALDVAFTIAPVAREDVSSYAELLADPYRLVVGLGHPFARRGSVRTDEVAEIDLVGYRVCRAHAQVERALQSRGIEPRVVMRAEDNQLLQSLAGQGVGAAIMPLLAIDPRREDTVMVAFAEPLPPRRIGLLWHRDRHLAPAAASFIHIAQEVGARLGRELSMADGLATAPALDHSAIGEARVNVASPGSTNARG